MKSYAAILLPLVIIFIGVYLFVPKAKKPFLINLIVFKYTFAVYCALLFLATLLVYALPEKDFVQQMQSDKTELTSDAYYFAHRLWDISGQDDPDSSKKLYQNFSEDYTLTGNLIKLDIADDFNGMVWIEQKDFKDGILEARNYLTPYLIESFDFSSQIRPPEINLNGDILQIKPSGRYSLDFKVFKDNFLTSQFRGSSPGSSFGSNMVSGNEAVHLYIPQGMEVSTSYGNIIYLN